MATVVHHKPKKPWIDALSNALIQGTSSIVEQRMERDRLATQIAENAKQRAADVFLENMRLQGAYARHKETVEQRKTEQADRKDQWAKQNADRDESNRISEMHAKVAQDQFNLKKQYEQSDLESMRLIGLIRDQVHISYNPSTGQFQHNHKSKEMRKLVAALEKSLKKGSRELAIHWDGINQQLWDEEKIRKANLPILSAIIAKPEGLQRLSNMLPRKEDGSLHTEKEILGDPKLLKILTDVTGNPTVWNAWAKDFGIDAIDGIEEFALGMVGGSKAALAKTRSEFGDVLVGMGEEPRNLGTTKREFIHNRAIANRYAENKDVWSKKFLGSRS